MGKIFKLGILWFLSVAVILTISATVMADATAVNKKVRNAERKYFSGNIQEADALLKEAEKEAEDILIGGDEAQIKKVKRLETKMKKLRRDIDRKLKASKPAAVPVEPAASGTSATGSQTPSYVLSKIKTAELSLKTSEDWLAKGNPGHAEKSAQVARRQLERAEEMYEAKYAISEHPQMIAAKERLAKIDAAVAENDAEKGRQKAAQAEAAAEAEELSEQWIERLKPYAVGLGRPDHDPERYFIGSYTAEKDEMARRTALYGTVKDLMVQYDEEGPGDAATDQLHNMVRDLKYNIESFEESTAMMADSFLQEADRKTRYLKNRIDAELKKVGSGEMPLAMQKAAFEDARRSIDGAAGLLGDDDDRVKALNESYRDLLAKNEKLAEARISETRMLPDKFSGKQKSAIEKKAEEVMKSKYSGIKLLRTNVISDDWKEDSAIEWTDTTKTALRHRVTRSVTVQIAGKLKNETKLYTLYVGKNRRSDGTWGQLQSHVMFIDPILEKNVNK